jgi:hypothetical protein
LQLFFRGQKIFSYKEYQYSTKARSDAIIFERYRPRRAEKIVGRTLVRYKLLQSLNAVKLTDHPGSSLRSPTSTLIEIPQGALVELEGAVGPSGLVNIIWDGTAFSVFHEDLTEKAEMIDSSGY